jgi:hypothetical protein
MKNLQQKELVASSFNPLNSQGHTELVEVGGCKICLI